MRKKPFLSYEQYPWKELNWPPGRARIFSMKMDALMFIKSRLQVDLILPSLVVIQLLCCLVINFTSGYPGFISLTENANSLKPISQLSSYARTCMVYMRNEQLMRDSFLKMILKCHHDAIIALYSPCGFRGMPPQIYQVPSTPISRLKWQQVVYDQGFGSTD